MDTIALLKRCRQSAVIEDAATDWTDALILDEMYDQLTQLYSASVVKSRQGYWKKEYPYQCTPGVDAYRMPPRAITGSMERLQIRLNATETWSDIEEIDETQALNYEQPAGMNGTPCRFVMRGDTFTLMPAPDQPYQLRCFYYLRPPRLVPNTPSAGNTMGAITAWDAATNTATLTAPVESWNGITWLAPIATGFFVFDIVSTDGWYEIAVPQIGGTVTNSGLTIQFFPLNTYGFPLDMGAVSAPGVGGVSTTQRSAVRIAGQSTHPCIPEDFHRTLADATAIRICSIRGMSEKAAALSSLVSADLDRFGDLLKPRVQHSGKVLYAPNMYRGVRRGLPGAKL